MARRLIHHARRHSVGYVALVFSMLAMAGGAYASFKVGTNEIQNGAVTEKKIHNQTIDPVKWDPTYVTAFIRRYASISADGTVVTGAPNTQAAKVGTTPNSYDVTWGDQWNATCIASATVQTSVPSNLTTPTAGFADTNVILQPGNATVVNVSTYDAKGAPTALPFTLAIICPRGAGGGQRYAYTLP